MVVGVELTIAFVILSPLILVMVAPQPDAGRAIVLSAQRHTLQICTRIQVVERPAGFGEQTSAPWRRFWLKAGNAQVHLCTGQPVPVAKIMQRFHR